MQSNNRAPGKTARMMRRAEDKERAILNKENSVTGKDLEAEQKRRISNKITENGDADEVQPLENKKSKGYLKDPLSTVKRVD